MCKRYIYARVSTQEQNFDQQLHEIKLYGINIDEVDDIVSEHESGGTSYTDRKLQSLLNRCKPGDEIFVASTDRLGRDFFDMIHLMEDAKKRGIIITACKQRLNLDDENPMSQMFLMFSTMFDQDERKRISRRTANKKASHREQIAKQGYFIVEKGINAGERRDYIGMPKWDDMSDKQQRAVIKMQEAAHKSATDKKIAWKEQSKAYRWTMDRVTENMPRKEIVRLFNEQHKYDPEFCTRSGKPLTEAILSGWVREANPLALVW